MPTNQQPSGNTPRLGVPSEARLTAQRQIEVEEVSRRYSNMVPDEKIKDSGQFMANLARRRWSVGGMVAIWLLAGAPALAIGMAGILSSVARGTRAEVTWGIALACLYSGIPLLALGVMTRNWLQQRKFARAVKRRT